MNTQIYEWDFFPRHPHEVRLSSRNSSTDCRVQVMPAAVERMKKNTCRLLAVICTSSHALPSFSLSGSQPAKRCTWNPAADRTRRINSFLGPQPETLVADLQSVLTIYVALLVLAQLVFCRLAYVLVLENRISQNTFKQRYVCIQLILSFSEQTASAFITSVDCAFH